VAVAMSGGVDSSVAAALLIEAGWDVVGVTLRMWQAGDSGASTKCEQDAVQVASNLGVPHYVLDVSSDFERCVIDDFVAEYGMGRTPNPCVRCNQAVKFGVLVPYARRELGAEWVATGHYARSDYDAQTGQVRLLRGVDRSKDQSYVLYRLGQQLLPHVLFPIGGLTKSLVRSKAASAGMAVSQRAESQDICFVAEGGYQGFVAARAPELVRPGPIIDTSGRRLGEHRGIAFYTIGQRRGLGVPSRGRLYVVAIDAAANTVVLGPSVELMRRRLVLSDVTLVSGEALSEPIVVSCKIRYNTQDSPAVVRPLGWRCAEVVFDEEQWAVTPGQSAVLYRGDEVLGGGIIAE